MTSDPPTPESALRQVVASASNPSGGWSYYAGRSSRIEPTCWSLLALGDEPDSRLSTLHGAFLARTQQASGWLTEDAAWPVNVCFNALAAFAWLTRADVVDRQRVQRLLAAVATSKGVRAPQTGTSMQNNSLQGWPWIDATFSWVEPTAWGLLALKQARRAGVAPPGADARIAEGERLLIDRVCRDGGWNYGNAALMHQDLRAYIPTTAVALLALQGRDEDPAVTRSLAYLDTHWRGEVSAMATGLALICLDAYGRVVAPIEERLVASLPEALAFGNQHGLAVALMALSPTERRRVFRF